MLANLLDEARFFAKYPPEELHMTGAIFGLLIHWGLVQGQALALILQEITGGLQQDPDSKLFRFGIEALGRFRDRLTTWPDLCRLLLSIPTFMQHGKDLAEIARAGIPTVNGGLTSGEASQQQSRASSVDLPAAARPNAGSQMDGPPGCCWRGHAAGLCIGRWPIDCRPAGGHLAACRAM